MLLILTACLQIKTWKRTLLGTYTSFGSKVSSRSLICKKIVNRVNWILLWAISWSPCLLKSMFAVLFIFSLRTIQIKKKTFYHLSQQIRNLFYTPWSSTSLTLPLRTLDCRMSHRPTIEGTLPFSIKTTGYCSICISLQIKVIKMHLSSCILLSTRP